MRVERYKGKLWEKHGFRGNMVSSAHLALPDVKSFQSLMDTLSKIVDEISFKITEEGVRAVALDPAQVAMIEITLPPDNFTEYEVDGEVSMGVNVNNVLKILKRGRKGDRLTIDVEVDRVTWSIIGGVIKRYKVMNLDVPTPEIPEASLEFNVRVVLLADPFKNALKDAEAVSDTLELDASSPDLFIIRGVGPTIAETKIGSESPALIEYEVSSPSKSQYSIDYIKHVVSLVRVADTVNIEFSSDMPLRMEFTLPPSGKVIYLLAPKAV